MRTVEINVYTFEELSEVAKQRAIKECRNSGEPYAIYEDVILLEEMQQALLGTGYSTDKIYYSLGYCQGDGVCFPGDVDVLKVGERLLESGKITEEDLATIKYLVEEWEFGVWLYKGRSLYCRSEFQVGGYDDDEEEMEWDGHEDRISYLNEVLERFLYKLDDDFQDLERELEKIGYGIIEFANSDEVISEYLKCCIEFTEDGEVF